MPSKTKSARFRPFCFETETDSVARFSFDVDLPLSCDDEYLGHPDPEKAFKQPPDIPSKMDYFISMIRLNQILAFSQRTLVCDPVPAVGSRTERLS